MWRCDVRLRGSGGSSPCGRLSRRIKGSGGSTGSWGHTKIEPDAGTTMLGRILTVPWYPWLVATAMPILHFLTSNPALSRSSEAVLPLAVALLAVYRRHGKSAGCSQGLASSSRYCLTAVATALLLLTAMSSALWTVLFDERILFSGQLLYLAPLSPVILGRDGQNSLAGRSFFNLTSPHAAGLSYRQPRRWERLRTLGRANRKTPMRLAGCAHGTLAIFEGLPPSTSGSAA